MKLIIGDTSEELSSCLTADAIMLDGKIITKQQVAELIQQNSELVSQVARLENELRQQKLIHIGFTNESQVQYVTEDNEEGAFYPNSDHGCYIPVYMLSIHAHRVGPDSEIYKEHCELWKHKNNLSEIRADAGRKGYAQAIFDQFAGDYQALDKLKDCADEYAERVRRGEA